MSENLARCAYILGSLCLGWVRSTIGNSCLFYAFLQKAACILGDLACLIQSLGHAETESRQQALNQCKSHCEKSLSLRQNKVALSESSTQMKGNKVVLTESSTQTRENFEVIPRSIYAQIGLSCTNGEKFSKDPKNNLYVNLSVCALLPESRIVLTEQMRNGIGIHT